jgi:hypothetical protein
MSTFSLEQLVDAEWDFIVRVINDASTLNYVSQTANGKKKIYRNRSNTWMDGPKPHCDGYDTCETEGDRFETDDPVDFDVKVGSFDPTDVNDMFGNDIQFSDKVKKAFDGKPEYFACRKRIIFKHNHDHPNFDHRGSDHTKVILDWEPVWPIVPSKGKIAIKDIAEAIFRIRSHKFDSNYEMLCGASKVVETSNIITVTISFDYGS